MSKVDKRRDYIRSILKTRGDEAGGIDELYDFVRQHDGMLDRFYTELIQVALRADIRNILGSDRDPDDGCREWLSVDVPKKDAKGKVVVDKDGNPVTEKVYKQKLFVFASVEETNQVVDYHVRRSGYHQTEANRIVKAARKTNRKYRRRLPFPDLDDDRSSA